MVRRRCYVPWTSRLTARANLDGSDVTTLATSQWYPSSVAVDDTHIYWTSCLTPGGMVKRADLDGSNVTTLVTGQDSPFAIAVDSSYVYWVNQGEINYATGTVNRAPLSDPSSVTTLVTGQWHPDGLAVDASRVYWAKLQRRDDQRGRARWQQPDGPGLRDGPTGRRRGRPTVSDMTTRASDRRHGKRHPGSAAVSRTRGTAHSAADEPPAPLAPSTSRSTRWAATPSSSSIPAPRRPRPGHRGAVRRRHRLLGARRG